MMNLQSYFTDRIRHFEFYAFTIEDAYVEKISKTDKSKNKVLKIINVGFIWLIL